MNRLKVGKGEWEKETNEKEDNIYEDTLVYQYSSNKLDYSLRKLDYSLRKLDYSLSRLLK